MVSLSFSKEVLSRLEDEKARAYSEDNIHKYRVIEALLLVGELDYSHSIDEIAHLTGVTSRTVYTWVKKFMAGGFKWLSRQWFRGRGAKSKLNQKQKDELYEIIVDGPEKCGFDSGIWNSPMVAELIWLKFGVKYNPCYLCRLLKKMGLSFQKAKFESDKTDEEEYEKARKEWIDITWPRILEDAKRENAIIMFGDEVSFAMWGSLSRTWAPVGKQPSVKTRGCRKGLKMFGAIEFRRGRFHFMESIAYTIKAKSLKQFKEEGMSAELLKKLKDLKNETYKNEEIYLSVLDQALGEQEVANYKETLLKYAKHEGAFNGETYKTFLQQLIDTSSSRIILIEDGAPYHNSKVVKEFIANQDQLSTERLPSFSPDVNTIEKLWKNAKRDATHC